jgi:hypothetical protein
MQQEAFDQLKAKVTEEPIIHLPNDEGKYKLETDGSGQALGAVLMQQQPDNSWATVAYYSATFSPAERNYTVED